MDNGTSANNSKNNGTEDSLGNNVVLSTVEGDAPIWLNEHNIFSQVRRRRWVRLKCLANVQEGCKAWLLDRMRTLDVINSFRDEVKEHVYENQRYLPIVGFRGGENLLLTDPGEYCNFDQSFSQMNDPKSKSKKLPEWEWKTSWNIQPNIDGDKEGWLYAINFSDYNDDFHGVTQPRPLIDFVRRRGLLRVCGGLNILDQALDFNGFIMAHKQVLQDRAMHHNSSQ